LETEDLELVSKDDVKRRGECIDLPGMSMAVLISTTEATENRQVQ
jgi:hypothetical protein